MEAAKEGTDTMAASRTRPHYPANTAACGFGDQLVFCQDAFFLLFKIQRLLSKI